MRSRRMRSRRRWRVSLLACLTLLIAIAPLPALGQATPGASDAPVPIAFPRDDGRHDTNIEWWYFTGHLQTATGERYGFEYVVFRARPGNVDGYVAHFAITDHPRERFAYDQRILGAKGVVGDRAALDLTLDGWTMRGENGRFALAATMPGYAIDLDVATTKPAALHDGDGYIDYGNGTASYYSSWTRLAVTGAIDAGSGPVAITGSAWMDHQWGDFATYQQGGWDWFAIQIDDDTDLMLYLIRGPEGEPLRVDGSIVGPHGELTVLRAGDFTLAPKAEWTSPATGTAYPSGWTIDIPAHNLHLDVTPVLRDQELDTRRTTGVIYWEGEVQVAGLRDGAPARGAGYVELTGYAPFQPRDRVTPVATPAP